MHHIKDVFDQPLQKTLVGHSPWKNEGGSKVELLLSGSFNPLHHGHLAMARHAANLLDKFCYFEIPVINCDKGSLDKDEVMRRANQFISIGKHVWISNAGTFVAKSKLFPECTFIVGVDTIIRVADPRYTFNDEYTRDECIDTLMRSGCKFLVYPRDGKKLSDYHDLPFKLYEICREADFTEIPVSSSKIRLQKGSTADILATARRDVELIEFGVQSRP